MKPTILIQKFLSQGLTEEERFDLEKKALDDDFLGDAWEGYQLHLEGDKHEVIPTLENRLAGQTVAADKGRVVSFRKYWPMAAAASVAVLLAATFFLRPSSADPLSNGTEMVALDKEVLKEDIAPQADLKQEPIASAPAVTTSKVPEAEIAREVIKKKAEEISTAQGKPEADLAVVTSEEESAQTKSEGIASNTRVVNTLARKRSEEISDEEVVAVVEATEDDIIIADPPEQTEIVIALEDQATGEAVALNTNQSEEAASANSIGFKNAKLGETLSIGKTMSLAPQSLDKASVGDRTLKFKSIVADTSKASPSMGWQAFNKYIEENASFKKDALFMIGAKEGDWEAVRLQFDLNKSNRPINITSKNPQGADIFNDEAIRLLKGSGTWSTLNPDKPIAITIKLPIIVRD